MTYRIVLRSVTAAAAVALCGASNAALTVYNTQASFLATIASPGVDTFAGFSIIGTTPSPTPRTAGAYSYTAAASTSTFFGAGTTTNPWLSTNLATDSITFSGFSGGVTGIGGNFFGSDIAGLFAAGNVTLTALDSTGASLTQTITGATVSSFLGFKSTGTITSLVVASVQPSPTSPLWPTVDNLTMGINPAAVIPEPQTYALLLAGLGALGVVARRRRR